MATTDSNEWRLYDTDLTTQLDILPTNSSHLYFILNEAGSGSLSIPLDSQAAGHVTSGQFAMADYRGSRRGGFFIDNISESKADQSEGGGRWMNMSGRGALALLDDAIVWDDGTTAKTRDFTNRTKAYILKTLIDEAKARGGLSTLTYDFSATVDSSSVSWTDSEDLSLNVGTSLLDVLRQFAEFGIDFDINYSSGTFVLSAYKNGMGTDKSETIYFRVGVNCVEVGSDERGDKIENAYRIAYKNGNVTISDSTSITNRRRREKFLDARVAQSSTSATTYGAALLADTKNPQLGITVKIYDGVGPRVFEDYGMGDYIMLDVLGVETKYRVLGIQCDWDGSQYSNVVVELNSLLTTKSIQMSQDITSLLNSWNTAQDANLQEVRFWANIGDVEGTEINCLTVSDGGYLYAGGVFDHIGGIAANNLAVYNISTGQWSAVGEGTNNRVRTIIANGTDIIIGGDFTQADGNAAGYVALFDEDTQAFDDMDGGLSTAVYGGAVEGSDIWVTQHNNIAVYSGGSWTSTAPIPSTFDEGIKEIKCLAIDNGIIYVGGVMEYDSGVGSYGSQLYQYNISTDTWTRVITEEIPARTIYSMAIHDGYLYFGGIFSDVESVSNTSGIARWEIATGDFSEVGGGIPLESGNIRFPYSMVVVGADLVLGGNFPAIGSSAMTTNKIARWDGFGYSVLDTGLNGNVYAVTQDQNNLYGNIFAGGIFSQAGDKPLGKIGEYINDFASLMEHLENSSAFDLGKAIHGAATSAISDDDEVPFWENVANALRKITWYNIKATLKTHFDTLYVALTGNQTIAGVKTFSSDPLIPDEAYDATAWDGVLEPPTKNAVRDKIESMSGFPTLTPLRIVTTDGAGAVETTDSLIFVEANEAVTMGTVVSGSVANYIISFLDAASSTFNIHTWGVGLASAVKGIFARGTKASPTAVLAEDPLFKLRGAGYDATTAVGSSATSGEIRVTANQNFSNTAHGTRVEVYTTPDGSTVLTKALTVQANGNINIETGKKYLIGGDDVLQPLDTDLTAIAALSPANDDIIQRKAGAWTNRTIAQYLADIKLPNGIATNYKIVPSVASNNLTVALKGLDGNDPSPTNPIVVQIGGEMRVITAALSVTKNAGTNWCNAGGAVLAAKEVDFFAYLGYNATDGIVIGFSRIPSAAIYSDFSTTTTNEKYCAISTITNAAAGDNYCNIGRFATTLSAGAGYTWTVPTYTTKNLVQRPIYETRELDFNTSATNLTVGSGTTNAAKYKRFFSDAEVYWKFTLSGSSIGAGATYIELPFTASSNIPTSNMIAFGEARYDDAGTATYYGKADFGAGAQYMRFIVNNASGTYLTASIINTTAPFTWGDADSLSGRMRYPTA